MLSSLTLAGFSSGEKLGFLYAISALPASAVPRARCSQGLEGQAGTCRGVMGISLFDITNQLKWGEGYSEGGGKNPLVASPSHRETHNFSYSTGLRWVGNNYPWYVVSRHHWWGGSHVAPGSGRPPRTAAGHCPHRLYAERGAGFHLDLPSGEKQCASLATTDYIISHNYVPVIHHMTYRLCQTPWQQGQLPRSEDSAAMRSNKKMSAMYHPKLWSFKFLFFVWSQKRIGLAGCPRRTVVIVCLLKSYGSLFKVGWLNKQTNERTNKRFCICNF